MLQDQYSSQDHSLSCLLGSLQVGQLLREAMTRRNPEKLAARKERRREKAKRKASILSTKSDTSASASAATLDTEGMTDLSGSTTHVADMSVSNADDAKQPASSDRRPSDVSGVAKTVGASLDLEPLPFDNPQTNQTYVFSFTDLQF